MYLQQIPVPILKGKTNSDLLSWAIEMQEALNLANYDKLKLLEWYDEN